MMVTAIIKEKYCLNLGMRVDSMKKYIVLAKNDYNEEFFSTDVKLEAKEAFDRMADKYLFVKVFCYNIKDRMYYDITDINMQTVYTVKTYTETELIEDTDGDYIKLLNEENYEFKNKLDALHCIIQSMKAGRKYKLYKNGKRDWSV